MCCIAQRRTSSCRWTSYLILSTSHVAWPRALLCVYIPGGTQGKLLAAPRFNSDTRTRRFHAHGSDVGNPNPAKRRRDSPRTHAPVSILYILWARMFDFVEGEEARIDGPCKFVFWSTLSNQQGKLTFPC